MEQVSLVEKWGSVLDVEGVAPIKDQYRKKVTAILLENQVKANEESRQALFENAPTNAVGSYADTGGIAKYDPVLISLVRRTAPMNIGFELCGVQPMVMPTGKIFARRAKYTNQAGTEALYQEANSGFAGTGTQAGTNPGVLNDTPAGTFTYGTGMTTAAGEALGTSGSPAIAEMAMTFESKMVEAKTRALKAEYTQELVQDLRAIHGLDAEQELIDILSTEIIAEQNREIVRTILTAAKPGAQYATVPGIFDLDTDAGGRWSVEKFKGLLFGIERDANQIAKETRLVRGNTIVCSSDVASALALAGVLDFAPAIQGSDIVDETSVTFAGILNGRFRVYIDPFLGSNNENWLAVIGKGADAYTAGLYYCPYQALQLQRAIDPNSFQPKIAFKTRYGLTAHPFANPTDVTGGLAANTNTFFRRLKVTNLL
ncbi:MAG TPA: hypothetical protein VFM18_13765 [Methanosarcina sp.]|nr:hypothetical protein [Methanosarcina sp.]